MILVFLNFSEKVIAVVNTDTDNNVCQGNSFRISKRQSEPAGKKHISFDVLAMAVTDCSDQIYQVHIIYKYCLRFTPSVNIIYMNLLLHT